MSITFTVIPDGQLTLRPLLRGNESTSFDVIKGNERIGKVTIPGRWNQNTYVAGSWGVLQSLRKSGLVTQDATLVVTYSQGIRFIEGSAMATSLDSRPAELSNVLDASE